MTLELKFAGWKRQDVSRFAPELVCMIRVTGIPEGTDPRTAETIVRHLVDRGLAAPVDFTLNWGALVAAGLEAGELKYAAPGVLAPVPDEARAW